MSEKTIEEEIAELRAKRRELEKVREQREQEAAPAARLAAERLRLKNDEAITAAIAEHGPVGDKIGILETRLGVVIVKRANHLHWNRFASLKDIKPADCDRLIRSCLVYPDAATWEAWSEEQPAIPPQVVLVIGELAGLRAEEVSGKS